MRTKAWLPAIIAAALVGCSSTTPVDQLSYTDTKKLAHELAARCEKQGYPQGHPEFLACMKQEINHEDGWRARRRAVANSTTYCQAFGASIVCF